MGQLGDLSPQGSVAVGVLVGLISTSVQSLGLTLQRKSHILEDEKGPHDARRPPHRRRRWQLGMLMFVVSNLVGSSIQITTLPLPVLSTLQASGLVFNTLFATMILGEPFTRYSLGGTLLVCAGAILIAIFGAIGEPAHNLDQLLFLLGRRQFLLWLSGTLIIVLAVILSTRALRLLSTKYPSHITRLRVIRGSAYGFVSGVLSAHSLLVAKSAVELLVRTIVDRVNQFNRWQSWIILLALIVLALSQLYYLHRGLKLCSTSVLYPFVFCVYNIIAILDGLIYFRQASRLSVLHAVLIAIGTVILLSGVLALSWRLNHASLDPTEPPTTLPQPAPRNPLTPGMGLVTNSPSSSSPSRSLYGPRSTDPEHQPLLQSFNSAHPPRRATTLIRAPEAAEIWAELDDSDSDTLASLPFERSPVALSHRRRRSASTVSRYGTSPSPSKVLPNSQHGRGKRLVSSPAASRSIEDVRRAGRMTWGGEWIRDDDVRRRRRRSSPLVLGWTRPDGQHGDGTGAEREEHDEGLDEDVNASPDEQERNEGGVNQANGGNGGWPQWFTWRGFGGKAKRDGKGRERDGGAEG